MEESSEFPVPGVTGLEHTADVGLEILAPTLPELFRRAAHGAMWLILERSPTAVGPRESREVELVEPELPGLLRSWLRRLVEWQEIDGFAVTEAAVTLFPAPLCSGQGGQALGLLARVEGVIDEGPIAREVKGVTLHDLRLEKRGDRWYGRVILDV